MPSLAPRLGALPAALALLVALGALAPRPADAEEKVFAEHNFKLAAPNDDWQWLDVPDDGKQAGYVTRLGRRKEGSVATVDVRVVPTNGLSLQELTDEVRTFLTSTLTPEGSKVTEGTLSGIKGTEVIVKGKARDGAPVFVRAWAIEAKGRFHQLIVTMRDGAEVKLASEIDKLRRAYRLLDGAGPEEPDVEGAGVPDVGGGAVAAGDDWPAKGPGREGNTLLFPHHNMRWNVPEGFPLRVHQVVEDESVEPDESGRLMILFAQAVDRKALQEGEPTVNTAQVLLVVSKPRPGVLANVIATSSGVQSSIAEHFFDKVEAAYTKVDEDVDVGNHKGARLRMAGRKAENVVYALFYWVVLKERQYEFRVFLEGGREADDVFKEAVLGLMKGVEFMDTTEWILGPIGVPEVPPFNQQRGHSEGQAKSGTSVGFTWEKPAEMSALTWEPQSGTGNLRVAWEIRSEDKQNYLYFDVSTYPYDPNRQDPEQALVDQRETYWLQGAEAAQTKTKGKKNAWTDRYGKGKGLGYEFEGQLRGVAFSERGYVVRYKKYIYQVRTQLGGKDAEKVFASTLKELKKAIDF